MQANRLTRRSCCPPISYPAAQPYGLTAESPRIETNPPALPMTTDISSLWRMDLAPGNAPPSSSFRKIVDMSLQLENALEIMKKRKRKKAKDNEEQIRMSSPDLQRSSTYNLPSRL